MALLDLFRLACDSGAKTVGDNTQYTIHEDSNNLYLAIQGSVQKSDWLYNFKFLAKPYKNMNEKWYVHGGFATCWKLARDQIIQDALDKLGNKRLIILGYSHGAALALLAHEWFEFNGYNSETYCFGCPRILWFPSKSIRNRFKNVKIIQRRGDLVTHVPPVMFGFIHPVKETMIGTPAMIWWRRHLQAEYVEALIL